MRRKIFASSVLAVLFLTTCAIAIGTDLSSIENNDKELNRIETRFFEHTYENDSPSDRIDRIEKFIFGCSQTGSLNQRLNHILAAVPDSGAEKISGAGSQVTATQTSSDKEGADQISGINNSSSTEPSASYSTYPRVTALEQELLGHTYQSDNVSRRLDRLETKAFGKTSTNNDLSERVDNLDDYAQRHDLYGDRKIANNTNSSLSFVHSKNPWQANQSVYPSDSELNKIVNPEQHTYTSKTGSFVGSIEERVAMMEAQEFDHTYPERPLDKRLKKLEKKILPGQDDSQLGLFQRTSKLWITLHPSDKNKMDNLIASNDTGTVYKPQAQAADKAIDSNSPSSDSGKHRSWLHKLANHLEAATANSYSGYSNFSNNPGFMYPYPGSFYVPQTINGPSVYVGGSFGPGAGPGGLPVGFW